MAEGRALLAGERPVAWRSIFKSKDLDAPAVIVTDVTAEAAAWADEHNLNWNDLLYVGMTRARYACTVLRGEGAPWRLASDRMHLPHREGVRVLGGATGGVLHRSPIPHD
ncbi:UvrD-like helicase family protein [Microcella alkaliphila]|uniref:UvrD-like helicase family protein n=1 Tax=Microcella alkaliphila TaxID=279828 RepID=A0A4Q7U0Z0_9MICO|nr:UvrD-like helicase family protein [Microcella alkaliphila]